MHYISSEVPVTSVSSVDKGPVSPPQTDAVKPSTHRVVAEKHPRLAKAPAQPEAVRKVDKEGRLSQYREVVENAPIALLQLDHSQHILSANSQCKALLGVPVSICLHTNFCDYLSPSSKVRFLNRLNREQSEPIAVEATVICPHTRGKDILILLTPSANRSAAVTVVALLDNTRQRSVETHYENARSYLQKMANNDALTGLSNRLYFKDNLRAAMLSARRSQRNVALLYFDIDKFKDVNDQYGHHAGDTLLCEIANRLRIRTRDVGSLARVGGDEFTLTIEYSGSIDRVIKEAENILTAIQSPVAIAPNTVRVSSSIGISIYPAHAKTPEELIKQADAAMYQAKAKGGNDVFVFSDTLQRSLKRQHELERGVRRGLRETEFFLEYQPIVECRTGALDGLEVLVRWNHPSFGTLRPSDFISIAERTGRINDLGLWVVEETCKTISAEESNCADTRFAINLSPIQLADTSVVRKIRSCTEKYDIDPARIEFEITENCVIHNLDSCLRLAAELNELGFSLSIDDFGTGYSSFSRLIDLPINRLKLDRQLIQDIAIRPNAMAIVKGIISIAHELGMKVVAEGVETVEQVRALQSRKCDFLQGYYVSSELTREQLSNYLGRTEVVSAC